MVTVLAPAGTDDFRWAWAKAGAESARARTIASPAVRTALDMRLLPTATAHAWAPNTTQAARVRRLSSARAVGIKRQLCRKPLCRGDRRSGRDDPAAGASKCAGCQLQPQKPPACDRCGHHQRACRRGREAEALVVLRVADQDDAGVAK